jgi:hypothetical protein
MYLGISIEITISALKFGVGLTSYFNSNISSLFHPTKGKCHPPHFISMFHFYLLPLPPILRFYYSNSIVYISLTKNSEYRIKHLGTAVKQRRRNREPGHKGHKVNCISHIGRIHRLKQTFYYCYHTTETAKTIRADAEFTNTDRVNMCSVNFAFCCIRIHVHIVCRPRHSSGG